MCVYSKPINNSLPAKADSRNSFLLLLWEFFSGVVCILLFLNLQFLDKEKVLHLESEVSELMHEKITLMQQVEMRDRQLVELEEHAKEQERKYLNEIKVLGLLKITLH